MSDGGNQGLEAALAALRELADTTAQQEYFAAHPELIQPGSVVALCQEIAHLVAVDLPQARLLAATARWLADRLDDDLCRARSDRAAANAAHFSGENETAQDLYELAAERFAQLGDELEAAITRSSSLLNLAYLGKYDQVSSWAAEARQVFQRLADRRRLAVLEHNLANILYRQDRWEEALDRYRAAYREFLEIDSPQDVAICLRNAAVCFISLHRFDDALEAYDKSRAYCQSKGLRQLMLEVDYNVAYLHYLRGEYTHAIRLFQAARRRCEEEGDDYHQALCDLDLSEIYLELNLIEEASNLARSAHAGFDQLGMPYEAAKALTNIASAAGRQNQIEEALELLRQARQIFVRERNHLWPALIDFYRAVVLYRAERHHQAMPLARDALKVFSSSSLAPRAATCELLISEMLLDLGKDERARWACRAARDWLVGHDLPAIEHQVFRILGRLEETHGRRQEALAAYRRSQGLMERLRSQLPGEDLKISFLEDKHVVYESLIWLSMGDAGISHDEGIFNDIEKAKSRSLADILFFRAHDLSPRTDHNSVLTEQVRRLRKELSWLYRQIDLEQMRSEPSSPDEIERIRQSSRRKESELLRSLRELQAADLELSSLQSGTVVDLSTFRESLPAEAMLVEFYIARATVFVCLVDHERLEIRRLAGASRTQELHRLLQFQLSRLALGEQVHHNLSLIEEVTLAHLQELYDMLIRPIAKLLQKRHLIFAPHGFLHFVPFHALHDGSGHLIDRFTISYTPSAGIFHFCDRRRAARGNRSLVLGVADSRAPHILEEVRTVARSLPSATLLIGEDASEEMLRRHASDSRYIHIATHGLFRQDNPMFSAIQLGTSRLSLFDLYDLRLDAELVVLSGCGTGLNAVLGADELVGLTRGLLYAGAQSVLVTLWDVNDASTAACMRLFYQHLAQTSRCAEALCRTMQDLREQYPHPYHWAPFALIGKAHGNA